MVTKQLIVSYSYEDYIKLDDKIITAYEYETKKWDKIIFLITKYKRSRSTVFLQTSKS